MLIAMTVRAVSGEAKTFAANRARGRIALTVGARDGISRRVRVRESGSLRVRFPHGRGDVLDAVIVNSAGGMAGGDRFDIALTVAEQAHLTVTSAAAEKVYRSLGPDAAFGLRLSVGPGAVLRWLPQETILFDAARFAREVEIDVAAGGRLLLAEAVVFGRLAMGEAMTTGRVFDRWRLRHAGRLVFAETLRLEGAIAAALARPAVAAGGVALATILMVPGDEAQVAAVRALGDACRGEVGISTWNGIVVARLCAADGALLRHDLIQVLSVVGDGPLPRLWLN